jgi:bifunctional non-homologous end joining protein LigD
VATCPLLARSIRFWSAITFLEWTPELRLRHPRFIGLRPDKDAGEVVRET